MHALDKLSKHNTAILGDFGVSGRDIGDSRSGYHNL